jgi:hypothetical protein
VQLIVLAKAPMPGRVKTRLVPPYTYRQAAALAEAALADTLDAALASRAEQVVIALDGRPGPWLPEGCHLIPQRGDALDERLSRTPGPTPEDRRSRSGWTRRRSRPAISTPP